MENNQDPDPSDTTIEIDFVSFIRQAGKITIETDHRLTGMFTSELWIHLNQEAVFLPPRNIFR
ncbi:MAG TPA: hypothetical protein VLM80_09335 [Anaerolineales bacterium]|nr:hypothetical protein [Anaerolineales bacterium]